jgi:hypothetical protein
VTTSEKVVVEPIVDNRNDSEHLDQTSHNWQRETPENKTTANHTINLEPSADTLSATSARINTEKKQALNDGGINVILLAVIAGACVVAAAIGIFLFRKFGISVCEMCHNLLSVQSNTDITFLSLPLRLKTS